MLIGGFASLMLQTLHPLAMAGVADHSRYREDPFGRLRRTARFVAGTTFGPSHLVDALVGEVRGVHRRIVGVAPDGRGYRADDPALLTWVHTAEVTSFLRAYQRFSGRPLPRVEKDRYLDEVARVAELLGAAGVPRSVTETRRYLRAVAPELHATPAALDAVAFLATPASASGAERVAQRVVVAAAADLLPPFARRALRIGPHLPGQVALDTAAGWAFAWTLRDALGPSPVGRVAADRASSPTSGVTG